MDTKNKIIDIIREVIDPELGIDVYTLGLIYEIKIINKKVFLKMTLSCPLCPIASDLVEQVKVKLKENNFNPKIEVVLDPPWKPTEEIKTLLGIN